MYLMFNSLIMIIYTISSVINVRNKMYSEIKPLSIKLLVKLIEVIERGFPDSQHDIHPRSSSSTGSGMG